MTGRPERRALGEGLTRAAEALAAGSDELRLHDAVLHLTQSLGASTVAIVSIAGEPEALQLVADSDEHRSTEDAEALLASPVIREALVSRDVAVGARGGSSPASSRRFPSSRAAKGAAYCWPCSRGRRREGR